MPHWISVIVLGAIEGFTEFLPVSSTGHLLIAERWLPHESEVFNVVIQCGTVLALLAIFSKKIQELLLRWRDSETRRYIAQLVLAFVITGVGGVLIKKLGFKLPEAITPVAWATLIGGVLFIWIEWVLSKRAPTGGITWAVAIAVGLGQLVAAAFPGSSRSGTTILFALLLGVGRTEAVEFSFLLGIPTLLAAGVFELHGAFRHPAAAPENWSMLALGTAVATITAFISVRWLLAFIRSHTFTGFGWYRVILGGALLDAYFMALI